MDKELILNEDIFKQLIKQFKIWPEKKNFKPRFNVQLLVFASYKPHPGSNIADALTARSLVFSNFLSETKGSCFKSGC